jgi:hypothetical protein
MQCKKCKIEKLDVDFYANDKTCKDCRKDGVKRNRLEKIDYYREYDRARGNRQPDGYVSEYREQYPNKYKAHTMIGNAIKGGHLFKQPCEDCGSEDSLHAHHDDYLKPLNVRWLCAAHHRQWHVANGEAANP